MIPGGKRLGGKNAWTPYYSKIEEGTGVGKGGSRDDHGAGKKGGKEGETSGGEILEKRRGAPEEKTEQRLKSREGTAKGTGGEKAEGGRRKNIQKRET